MGSCFSRPKDEPKTAPASRPVTGASRFATTENRLGSREDPVSVRPLEPSEKAAPRTTRATSQPSTLESREAAARAAELRYSNQQLGVKNSEQKMRELAKMSKKEKGLA